MGGRLSLAFQKGPIRDTQCVLVAFLVDAMGPIAGASTSRGISGAECGGTSGRPGHEPASAVKRRRRDSNPARDSPMGALTAFRRIGFMSEEET